MLVEQTHPAESLLATLARILLRLEVSLKVGSQVRLVGEAPRAVVAGKRLLASVSSDVTLEKSGSGEALAAEVALAGEGVRTRVHLQRRQRRVTLVAKFARKSFLDLVGSVQFLMLDVSGLGRKSLFAIGTEERFFTGGRFPV